MDCSGKAGITLSFWHYWKADYSSGNQDGYVRGSIDGGTTWPYLIDEFHHNDPAEETAVKNYDISSWADGQAQVMIRYDITNDNDWYWYIDDFYVNATIAGDLVYASETTVSFDAYEQKYVEFSPAWNAYMGIYGIQVSTLLSGDENPSNDYAVETVSVEGPSLAYDPSSCNLGSILVNTTDETSFDIWNEGIGILTYTLDESATWVVLSSYSGTSAGEHDTITVTINTTGLTDGIAYHCDIGISSDGGSGVFGIDMFVVNSTTPLLDVEQTVYDRGFPIRHTSDGDWGGAQNFTPTCNTVAQVEIYGRKMGTPEFDLTVELREDGPDDLTGTLLDTVVIPAGSIPESYGWITVDFADALVEAGSDVFIVCPPAPSGVTTSFGYEWGYALGNQYDGGSFWFTRDGGNWWRDLPTMYEFTFKTYGY
jgi:hypothetical protein